MVKKNIIGFQLLLSNFISSNMILEENQFRSVNQQLR